MLWKTEHHGQSLGAERGKKFEQLLYLTKPFLPLFYNNSEPQVNY